MVSRESTPARAVTTPLGQTGSRIAILLLFIALVLVADWLLILPDNLFGRSVQNALHIPAFFIFTMLLHRLFPAWGLVRLLIAAVSAGFALELVQVFTPRDASLLDLFRNLLGVVLALALVAVLAAARSTRVANAGASALVISLLLISAADPARYLLAYHYRDRQFPALLSPDAWQLTPLLTGRTDYQWRSVSAAEAASLGLEPGQRVLSLVMNQDQYPGVTLQEAVGNWACYNTLALTFLVNAPAAIPLRVAVGYTGTPGSAAYVFQDFPTGAGTWRIPMVDLLRSTLPTPQISHVIVYSSPSAAGAELLLAGMALIEPISPAPPDC